jgi:hypothetical protein
MLFTKEMHMTLYRTIKVAVALLLAVQLGVSFIGSQASMHVFPALTQPPTSTAHHDGTSGLAEHAPFVSFATLIYQAYP